MIFSRKWWICSRVLILTRYVLTNKAQLVEHDPDADAIQALAAAGITPDSSRTYTLSQMQSALSQVSNGTTVYLGCQSGTLNEVWYFFNVRGNVIDGQYKATKSRKL